MRLRVPRLAILVVVLTGGDAFAGGVTVCSPGLPDTGIRAGMSLAGDQGFRGRAGEVAPRRTLLGIDWRLNGQWSAGIAHRYTDLNVNGLPIRGNGHLHTVWLPLRYQREGADSRVMLALAPALSATSNTVRRPDRWHSDDVQFLAAAVWSRNLSNNATLHLGLCRDFRGGSATVYLMLRYDGEAGRWRYRAGFPESSLTRVLGDSVAMGIGIAPAGNRWRAYERDFLASSPLEHRAWFAAARLDWRPLENGDVTFFAGTEFANRWRMVTSDGTQLVLRGDNALRAGVQLRWRF